MTKDDLIQMALECDLLDSRDDLDQPAFAEIIAAIERFYHLAVAAERESCAKVCAVLAAKTTLSSGLTVFDPVDCAEAIRARSQS